ncbi:ATP-binding protein [Arenibaculum pallidiluteum]|uniref:ATP-binding protein n=1 Tax=Arenibaculum pallidiluteum TaxID=2812559 RepID=UPI001A97D013|nr:sensor histidine kinase [Arenibaculum pallidiluteum]
MPLALIANELVTNALKYAYPDRAGGPVRIVLGRTGDRIELVVRDRGQGLPADFAARQSRSLGMRIILSLPEQIGAEVWIGNAGPGTECRVVLHAGTGGA